MIATRRILTVPGWLVSLSLLLFILAALANPLIVSAFSGYGGYISEKTLGDGVGEDLYLGNGTNFLSIVGTAPVITTVSAVSSNPSSSTLTGNIASLNGMPSASFWFVWGYSPSSLVYTSAVTATTTTGQKTAVINPSAGGVVYYQFRASTDGISYGSVKSFDAAGGHTLSRWMLQTLLPIAIAAVLVITVFLLSGNPLAALMAGTVGLIGFYLIQAMTSLF